jgi:hypothetical protein
MRRMRILYKRGYNLKINPGGRVRQRRVPRPPLTKYFFIWWSRYRGGRCTLLAFVATRPPELDETMHILVTNDDGVQAPGLLALAQEMRKLGRVTVFAPDRNWSASGHVKTMERPLRVIETTPCGRDDRLRLGRRAVRLCRPSHCLALSRRISTWWFRASIRMPTSDMTSPTRARSPPPWRRSLQA